MIAQGHIDGAESGLVHGWARDAARPDQAVWLDILIDGQGAATILAADPRADLALIFNNAGRHAFSFALPMRLADGQEHVVSARFAGTDVELGGSPLALRPAQALHISRHYEVESAEALFRRTPSEIPRGQSLAPAGSYDWSVSILEAAPDGFRERSVPQGWSEPEAIALSIPGARIHRWDTIGTGPGRVLDASFVSSPGDEVGLDVDGRHYWPNYALVDSVVSLPHPVVHLFRPGIHNYYHWIADCLPQLWALRQTDFKDTPILVNESSFRRGQDNWERDRAVKFHCLAALGYGEGSFVRVEAGAVDVTLAHMPLATTRPVLAPALAIHDELRAALAAPAENGLDLFISRAEAGSRRIANEAALLAVLEPLGFLKVLPERLSLDEQIGLFARARRVIAPHGAGLANLLFMEPGARVVELLPKPMAARLFIFSRLAHLRGLRHVVALCGEDGEARDVGDFTVDPALVLAGLESLS